MKRQDVGDDVMKSLIICIFHQLEMCNSGRQAHGIMVVVTSTIVRLLMCAQSGVNIYISAASLADWDSSRHSTWANIGSQQFGNIHYRKQPYQPYLAMRDTACDFL
jgi:hypothetical protein